MFMVNLPVGESTPGVPVRDELPFGLCLSSGVEGAEPQSFRRADCSAAFWRPRASIRSARLDTDPEGGQNK